MQRPARIFADARSRRTALLTLVVLLAVMGLSGLVVRQHLGWLADPAAIRTFVDGFGVLGPLAFVLLQAMQVVLAPVPGQVFALASGWLFGAFWGTVYSLLGATLGSVVAFALARRYGRPFVTRLLDESTLALLEDFSSDHGYTVLFVLFLLPGIPDDIICFVAGTTDLDIKQMTVVSVLGRLPGYVLVNLAGASLASAEYVTTAVVLVVLTLASAVAYTRRSWLLGRVLGHEREESQR